MIDAGIEAAGDDAARFAGDLVHEHARIVQHRPQPLRQVVDLQHDLIRVVNQPIHVLVQLRIVDQLPQCPLAAVERLREHGELLDQAIQAVDGIDDRMWRFPRRAGRAAR